MANGSNETVPWLYDINVDDTAWIITSSFMIFSMQTGFGMLESGCVSIKNEVNIMMKNVVDIVLGGLTYWMFGYGLSYGRSSYSNSFISFGDWLIDPDMLDPKKGTIYAAFIFQLSFATTATTIVSGAMAERCNFKAYCIFSFLNTIIYCIPAGWVWGEIGFLRKLGVVDIAGSGPVHLIGGSAALAAAIMLGPRMGRYDKGIAPLPLGNPVNAVMGLFVLWWGWLAFNSGSTYGLADDKWKYAAKASVMTMIGSFGGGTVSLFYTMIVDHGRVEVVTIINGVLGGLVAITAGCFLYTAWESLLVGSIGALLVCFAMPIFDKMGIDDPVGASSVHGIGGIWGRCNSRWPVRRRSDSAGHDQFSEGTCSRWGWYLFGVQVLAAVCLFFWGMISCMILLFLINKVVMIRMDLHHELMGADLTEHRVKHPQVGVSRAVSAFRPMIDTTEMENVFGIGHNPGHDSNLEVMKKLNPVRNYKLSRVLRDVTRSRNFGINPARKLFPRKKELRKKAVESAATVVERAVTRGADTKTVTPIMNVQSSVVINKEDKLPAPIAWLD